MSLFPLLSWVQRVSKIQKYHLWVHRESNPESTPFPLNFYGKLWLFWCLVSSTVLGSTITTANFGSSQLREGALFNAGNFFVGVKMIETKKQLTNFLLKNGKHQYLNVSHKNLKCHSWGGSLLEWEIAVDLFVGLRFQSPSPIGGSKDAYGLYGKSTRGYKRLHTNQMCQVQILENGNWQVKMQTSPKSKKVLEIFNDESQNFDMKKVTKPNNIQFLLWKSTWVCYPALNSPPKTWCHQPESATAPSVDVTRCILALDQRNKKEPWNLNKKFDCSSSFQKIVCFWS